MLFLSMLDSPEEQTKFRRFYEKYVGLVLWISGTRLRNNQAIAEECAQETFLYLAKNFSKIDEIESGQTKAYVAVVATTYAIKWFHQEFEPVPFKAEINMEYEDVGDELRIYDTYELKEAVDQLEDDTKMIVYLKYAHGLSVPEINEMCRMSEYMIRKKLREARAKIKEYIERDE